MASKLETKQNVAYLTITEDLPKETENIWVELLVKCQSRTRVKLPTNKSILIFGDEQSGKTSLVSALKGSHDVKDGSGLEFSYINVRDDYREDKTRLGVWILDKNLHHKNLLNYVINEQTFEHVTAVIVVSLSNPWHIMKSLRQWAQVLEEHVLSLQLDSDFLKRRKYEVLKQFMDYVSPEDLTLHSPQYRSVNSETDGASVDLYQFLSENEQAFLKRIGIPIIVVVTKSDAVYDLEKDYGYKNQHWDFIQLHIRQFCLHYGAALLYTSVKNDRNMDVLHQYLAHRLYGLPFNTPACVTEKDAFFIPMGWDSDKKIGLLRNGSLSINHPDKSYEDIITCPLPITDKVSTEESSTDGGQAFLQKIQSMLVSLPPPAITPVLRVDPQDSPVLVTSTTSVKRVGSASSFKPRAAHRPNRWRQIILPPTIWSVRSPGLDVVCIIKMLMRPGKKDSAGNSVSSTSTDTGLLVNFFNSLLTKQPASSQTAGENTASSGLGTKIKKESSQTHKESNLSTSEGVKIKKESK